MVLSKQVRGQTPVNPKRSNPDKTYFDDTYSDMYR